MSAPKKRYEITGVVDGEGRRKHTIKAANRDEAKGRFRRAYSTKSVQILEVVGLD